MDRIFIFWCILLLTGCSPVTSIYVVRHAEKQVQGSQDRIHPNEIPLSEAGHARARVLADTMRRKKLNAVFATNITRTQQTVQPTANAKGLPVHIYAATQPAANTLLDSLVLLKGKKILIAGHSNTVPGMIRHLGLTFSFSGNIPDNDYDNFFIITIQRGVKTIKQSTYGPPSP